MAAIGRKPIRFYSDASGQTWHHVPGYGRVNWPVEQITEHARSISGLHRPDQPVMALRLVWGVLPYVAWPHRRCKACLTSWRCRDAQWATWWFDSLERGWRGIVEAGP
jgi:hypothetical protein